MVKVSKAVIGKKVRFINRAIHKEHPNIYPAYGTIGVLLNGSMDKDTPYVQWPKGCTSGFDRCFCSSMDLELVEQKQEEEKTFILLAEYVSNEIVVKRYFVCRAENEELAKYLVESRVLLGKTIFVKFLSVREMDANEVFVGW